MEVSANMTNFGTLDMVIFFIYVVVLFVIGASFSRKQKTKDEFFIGGRRMPWFAVGVSIFAASFSAIAFLAYPREGAYEDYHLFLTLLHIPVVITPVLAFVFVPLYLRLKLNSVYGYLEIRFNRPMRLVGTILFAGYAIGWMGSILYAMGLVMQAVLGLTDVQMMLVIAGIGAFAIIYTAMGGIEAIIWNDLLQTFTLGGGMLIVFFLALRHIDGGLGTVLSLGAENNKFDMFNMDLRLAERRTLYAACAYGLFMYLPGYVVSQVTVQRYLCMSSLKQARRALLANCTVGTAVCFIFFVVGSVMYAYYHQAGATGFPELSRQDQLLPHFVVTVLRIPGLMGLLIAGLFAAGLSTIDGGISSLSSVLVYDWLSGRNIGVGISRLVCCLFGGLIVCAALISPYLGSYLIEIIGKIAGTFLGLLLGMYLLGMFVPRANTTGAFVGLAAGAVALAVVWTQTALPHWWYGAVTTFVTLGVGAVASRLAPAPHPDKRVALFARKSN